MLKPYSAMFSRFIFGLYDFEKEYVWRGMVNREKELVDERDAEFIRFYLDEVLKMALELNLESVPPVVNRIQGYLSAGGYKTTNAAKDLEKLRERILDQVDSRWFLFVNASQVGYYQNPDQFGPEVSQRFAAAIDDIEGAGKCLALGEGTACVLHLMRVMEVGLKELARTLEIPYAPSWEGYLKQIQSKISTQYATKTIDWKRDEPFFRDVSGDLISVKQVWRNPTMHVGRKYSAEEAEEIFRAVRSFMQRLAKGLPPCVLGSEA